MFLRILYNFLFMWCFYLTGVLSLFESCNHKVDMKPGQKLYVNSPYYPAEYPIGSSCRYAIKAPPDYELKFTCNIKLNTVRIKRLQMALRPNYTLSYRIEYKLEYSLD